MNLKPQFPIFKNKKLIYLDSAATSQKPEVVINRIKQFYEKENANIHRGVYDLSEKATQEYENARKTIAKFINASEKEIIFTRSTTESINLLASTLKAIISSERDEIVLSEMEHHSNIVPWQRVAKRFNMKLKFIKINQNFELDYEDAKQKITSKTAIVSVTNISNVTGTINNIELIANIAKSNGALSIIDAAQSIAHKKIDVKKINCDFLVFSGHKMYGPLGIGILYGKYELLKKLPPYNLGGDMIKQVSFESSTFQEPPQKFEAGTQNIGGAIALGEAVKFMEKTNLHKIERYESELKDYAIFQLKSLNNIIIYAPKNKSNHSNIISFNLKEIHAHDVASILNDYQICIRGGHHCCMPLMNKLGISGTARISLAIYNTKSDIDKLITAIKKCQEVFNK